MPIELTQQVGSMEAMEGITAVCVGVALAAACGFRVFVPAFVFSVAAYNEALPMELAEEWEWVGSLPMMLALGVATGVEIAAYYVPWIDNALDSIATPSAIVAGTLVSAAAMSDFDPMMQWMGAVVGGGGSAATVQTGTVLVRALSSGTTGGLGNPVVSTGEAAGSTGLSILAIILAPLAALIVLVFMIWIFRKLFGRKKAATVTATSSDPPPGPAA